MASPETEQLLSETDQKHTAGVENTEDDNTATTSKHSSSNLIPVTHYQSLSVGYQYSKSTQPISGSAKVVEKDIGGKNDFWNIRMDFIWNPRGKKSNIVAIGSFSDDGINISIDNLFAMRVQKSLPTPSVTLFLRGGAKLGSFLFPNGIDAASKFIETLRDHTESFLLESDHERGELYALEKKQRMRRVAPTLMGPSGSNTNDSEFDHLLRDLHIDSATSSRDNGRRSRREASTQNKRNPEDFGLMLLTQFAKVTQAAREIGDDVVMLIDEKKRRTERERKERDRAARRRALDIYADIVASTDVEKELPPRLTLDEKRGIPVNSSVWNESLDCNGALMDPSVMRHAIFCGGVESDLRQEVWPLILGLYPWNSTEEERNAIMQKKTMEYELLKEEWLKIKSNATAAEEESLASNPDAVTIDRRKRIDKAFADYLETEDQIEKDIVRTDRDLPLYKEDNAPATLLMGKLLKVYAIHDKQITYCQGMSDFLAPIIHVLGANSEVLTFWCFASLMTRIEINFRIDQSGMREQLSKLRKLIAKADPELASFFAKTDPDYYACFRWILVRFKRELPMESSERLWEVLWTRQVGGDDFHIFVAAALLIAHRRQLLSLPEGAFDMLLRYVNDMSMRIDIDFAIREGQFCSEKYDGTI